MGRWEPGAKERLILAAVDLFTERGYDETTVAEIAERAGVGKSTFFRYFPDKREVLVAGQAMLSDLLAQGIAAAPAEATPLDAVAGGLQAVSDAMTPFNRELAPRITLAVAANAELKERSLLKRVGMSAATSAALRARGVPAATAELAAELGMLAFHQGFERWTAEGSPADADLASFTLAALAELRTATAALG